NLLEARRVDPHPHPRQRADDLYPPGCPSLSRGRRRGDRARRRGAAHSFTDAAPGRGARGHPRARRVQPDSDGVDGLGRRRKPLMATQARARGATAAASGALGLRLLAVLIGIFFIGMSTTKIAWLTDSSI